MLGIGIGIGIGPFGGGPTLMQRLLAIFSTGTNGYIYDPSNIASLNQLSTGTTPVTAVTQPVGLMLDSRLGLALGPELVTNGTFDTDISGWIKGSGTTDPISWSNGKLRVTNDIAYYASGNTTISGLTVGATYRVLATNTSGSVGGGINIVGVGGTNTPVSVGVQSQLIFKATGTSHQVSCENQLTTLGGYTEWDNISVKLLEGNHALQATAPARPTWQVDAQGFYYLSFLGTDDSLTSATGGGGSAGFFWCGVVQPTGGVGTLQTLFADNGTNTGYKVQKDVNNKLSFSAGNNTAFTTKVSTAALSIGTKVMLTVWDDGTNLNVQIGDAAAEIVARPVVVAGTAGYTIGKDNGAASSFYIGYKYPGVYAKDTGLTATQRATAQAFVKQKAGL